MPYSPPPQPFDEENQNENSPLLPVTQENNKRPKTPENKKIYKTSSSQTDFKRNIKEIDILQAHDKLITQDITFLNSKTQLEETRTRVKGVYAAWLGDTKHRFDCQLAIGCLNDRELQGYVSAKAQSLFLKTHYPEAVPPHNPNGTPPSDHTIATVFEILYFTQEGFDLHYLKTTFDI
jgi:hypothetical protein